MKLKLKTHRGAAKRFKVTGSGKITRHHALARHILTKKAAKRTTGHCIMGKIEQRLRLIKSSGQTTDDRPQPTDVNAGADRSAVYPP